MRSSGRMLQSEMSQNVVEGAFDASFPASGRSGGNVSACSRSFAAKRS